MQPPGDSDGVGGTGVIVENNTDGIGGTGKIDSSDPGDGVGGTGLWADVGDVALFGVVTATEPLVINGHGLLVDEMTQFSLNGAVAEANQLMIGQVAWIKAGVRENGIFADEVAVQFSVAGRITEINLSNSELDVLGQSVRFGAQTKLVRQPSASVSDEDSITGNVGFEGLTIEELAIADLAVGDWIEVAGLRDRTGTIEATLIVGTSIDKTSYLQIPFVNGLVTRDENGRYHLGALDIPASPAFEGDSRRISVAGHYEQGEFSMTSKVVSPSLPFAEEVSAYSVQGYFMGSASSLGATRFGGLHQRLIMTSKIAASASSRESDRPMILEFKTNMDNALEVLDLKEPARLFKHQMIIPKYSPTLPNGDFSAIRRAQQPTNGRSNTIPIDKRIDHRSAPPSDSQRPLPRLNRGNGPSVRPSDHVGNGPRHRPARVLRRVPIIRTPPPGDVVMPQVPAVQTSTDVIGPR